MITLIFTIVSALFDNNKRFTDHTSRFVFRAIIVCLISVVEVPTILVGVWKPTLLQFALNSSIFYLVFDYLLNVLENRKWNYIGSTSIIDRFWLKIGWIWQLTFKITILLTFKTL